MRAAVGRLAGAELLNSGTLPNFETDPIPTFQLSPSDIPILMQAKVEYAKLQ